MMLSEDEVPLDTIADVRIFHFGTLSMSQKPVAPAFQLMVKLIQHDVCQQRGKVFSLRYSHLCFLKPASHHNSRFQIFPNQRYDSSVLYLSAEYFYQLVLVQHSGNLLSVVTAIV